MAVEYALSKGDKKIVYSMTMKGYSIMPQVAGKEKMNHQKRIMTKLIAY